MAQRIRSTRAIIPNIESPFSALRPLVQGLKGASTLMLEES